MATKNKKAAAPKKAAKKSAPKKAAKVRSIPVVSATSAVEARRALREYFITPQVNADGIEKMPTPWERTQARRAMAAKIKAENRERSTKQN